MPKQVHGSVEMPSSDGEVSRTGSVLWSDKGTKIVQGSTAVRCIQVQIYYYDKSPAKWAECFPLVGVPLRNDCTLLLFARGGVSIPSTSSSAQMICLWKLVLMIQRLSVFFIFMYFKSMVRKHGEASSCFEQCLVTWELLRFIYSNTGSSAMAVSCNNMLSRFSPWFKEKRFAQVPFFYFKLFIRKIFISSLKLQQFHKVLRAWITCLGWLICCWSKLCLLTCMSAHTH